LAEADRRIHRGSIIGNLGKNSTATPDAAPAGSVGDRTIRRKRDLDQSSGLGRAFDPKLRVIGLGERLGQW
jgi:hypothetical protein